MTSRSVSPLCQDSDVDFTTSYQHQFVDKSHEGPRTVNYSKLHYEKRRAESKLEHVADANDHYRSVMSSTITGRHRPVELRDVVRPTPFPLEVRKVIRTSPFQFQTTNQGTYAQFQYEPSSTSCVSLPAVAGAQGRTLGGGAAVKVDREIKQQGTVVATPAIAHVPGRISPPPPSISLEHHCVTPLECRKTQVKGVLDRCRVGGALSPTVMERDLYSNGGEALASMQQELFTSKSTEKRLLAHAAKVAVGSSLDARELAASTMTMKEQQPCFSPSIVSVKQLVESRCASMAKGLYGGVVKDAPFSFPDELMVDHSQRYHREDVTTAYQHACNDVASSWKSAKKRSSTTTKSKGTNHDDAGRQQPIKHEPTISLSYADEKMTLEEESLLCCGCIKKRERLHRYQQADVDDAPRSVTSMKVNRKGYFTTTNQELMGTVSPVKLPPRAHSSLQ